MGFFGSSRSVLSLPKRPSLTFRFQSELAMHVRVAVLDTHDVSSTSTITSGIHHNVLKGSGHADDRHLEVSVPNTMDVTEQPLTTSQAYARSAILATSAFNISYIHSAHPGSFHLLYEGTRTEQILIFVPTLCGAVPMSSLTKLTPWSPKSFILW